MKRLSLCWDILDETASIEQRLQQGKAILAYMEFNWRRKTVYFRWCLAITVALCYLNLG